MLYITPTKAQWQTVIDNFKKVLPFTEKDPKKHLNMLEACVKNSSHECGTVHCVGGWYAVATCDLTEQYITYAQGADHMAEDLGFDCFHSVSCWARDNPQIWGNQHGYVMFSAPEAYGNATTLAEVVKYLEGVRDRSPD